MELYPSIPTEILKLPIYAFDKLDGSNIRAEWTRKNGFFKFGTRKRLLDPNEEPLGEAVALIQAKYSEELNQIFRKQRLEKATAFFEFYGKNSFAGIHQDEEHNVVLFDVHIAKKGFLLPKEFINIFDERVEIPAVLYNGIANDVFIKSVKESSLDGMTYEGVVCKGALNRHNQVTRFKIKSEEWKDAVKEKYQNKPWLLKELL